MTISFRESTTTDRRALQAVAAQFFVNGAVLASFVPRLPEIRDSLDLSLDELGAILTAGAALGLLASLWSPRIIAAFGTRRALILFVLVLLCGLQIVGLRRSLVDAFVGFGGDVGRRRRCRHRNEPSGILVEYSTARACDESPAWALEPWRSDRGDRRCAGRRDRDFVADALDRCQRRAARCSRLCRVGAVEGRRRSKHRVPRSAAARPAERGSGGSRWYCSPPPAGLPSPSNSSRPIGPHSG